MNENGRMKRSMVLIFATVLLTVYCQLIVKWRVGQAGAPPLDLVQKLIFLTRLLFDPWMLTVMLAALLAGLSWFAVMTKYQLSYAYPFMSLAFVLVLLLSAFLFHEAVTVPKVVGLAVVIMGLIIASRG
jgi:multidrug transporter EmrE-like cation transporter